MKLTRGSTGIWVDANLKRASFVSCLLLPTSRTDGFSIKEQIAFPSPSITICYWVGDLERRSNLARISHYLLRIGDTVQGHREPEYGTVARVWAGKGPLYHRWSSSLLSSGERRSCMTDCRDFCWWCAYAGIIFGTGHFEAVFLIRLGVPFSWRKFRLECGGAGWPNCSGVCALGFLNLFLDEWFLELPGVKECHRGIDCGITWAVQVAVSVGGFESVVIFFGWVDRVVKRDGVCSQIASIEWRKGRFSELWCGCFHFER